jgi:hypothetical protein
MLCVCALAAGRASAQQAYQQKEAAKKHAMLQDRAAEARAKYEAAARQLKELQTVLRDRTDRLDVSAEAVRKSIAWLEEQRETLELDEAGAAARRLAVAQAVEEATKKAEVAAKDDAVALELRALVKYRETALARTEELYKTGATPAATVDAAQAQLAEARAQLAARRREAVAGAGADAVATWNRELVDLTIGEKERHARLDYIADKLMRLRAAIDLVDQVHQQEALVRDAQQEAKTAEARAEEARLRLDESRPPPPATRPGA